MSQNLDDKQILNIIAEIDRLKVIQAQHITDGNLERALEVSNTISELAKKINSPYIIDEQKDYLSNVSAKNNVVTNVQDIKLIGNELKKNFYDLLEIEHLTEAHELIENFKKKYADNPIFETLHFVNALIDKDKKVWIQYLSTPK